MDEIRPVTEVYEDDRKVDDELPKDTAPWTPPDEWLERFMDEYTGQHGGETLPPGSDPARVASSVLTLDIHASAEILNRYIEEHSIDYTFDGSLMDRMKELVKGPADDKTESGEWAYEICRCAGMIHNWSPYAEIRAVTVPYDDPEEPCETFRAYILGIFWVIVVTSINTFFAPRQPGITVPGSCVQLLLVPMGRFMAQVLPNWGLTLWGHRYTLNPGPWSAKEQLWATIFFAGASTIGNFTGLLVLRLPAFMNQQWATTGFGIIFSLGNQIFGLGAAGVLRRISVYPLEAVWPGNLPTIALNRTLINQENEQETINRWKITRFRCFVASAGFFILYYWIPNEVFQALRLFNWMTWIKPDNFNLAIVTGSYGGMGYNPWSSFDPSTSGSAAMNSPFFAQLQQFILRAISGIIIIILYYRNVSWGAYLPINTNGSFDNTFKSYNISRVLTADNKLDVAKYRAYGPPYYGIAYLYQTGANYVYYTFSFTYVFGRYWRRISKAFVGIYKNTRYRRSVYTGFDDGASRMMRKYPEAPEWWYLCILVFGFICCIVSLTAWPTQTPWWTVPAYAVIGMVLVIPWVIIESIANTGIQLSVIWNLLPGLWFPGQDLPQLFLLMLGDSFPVMAGSFSQDLKYGHYARLPPRAIFRAHTISLFINIVVFTLFVDVMLAYANDNNTLCQWDNKQYMVCAGAHGVYSSVIAFGVFGTANLFKLYPLLPWCFLLGAILGAAWLIGEWYGPVVRARLSELLDQKRFELLDTYIYRPLALAFDLIHPAIALSGAIGWAGNNNLTYATLGIYIAWLFQYYLKRRYTAWWGKYAFMIFQGLSLGTSIAGLIVTLVFGFGAGKNANFSWWGNKVHQEGVDFALYNNEVALLPVPEKGYFGLEPEHYPI